MTAFSKIDMSEVTRLTHAGRLAEAMALLKGRADAAGPSGKTSAGKTSAGFNAGKRPGPTIDMVAPSVAGGAWTAPGFTAGPRSEASPAASRAAVPDIAEAMRAFRDNLAKGGAMKGAMSGAGSPLRAPVPVPDGARFEERSFSNAAGSRSYKVFVPSGYHGQALPVVVMLHGCTQDPDDFAAGTGMNALAEEQTFLVAYPRQPPSANMQKCWNWFNAGDQDREGGEPSLIAGIAREVIAEFSADAARVYVAGLSAGGAAAAIMAATYPDLFAAAGIHSGLACGAARDMPSAFAAMNGGGPVRPRGDGPVVPTIVFHGDADRTVHPVNGDQVIAQAAPDTVLGRTVTRGETPGGIGYTRTVQADAAGRDILEQWVVHGAGHAWSGGSASGSYTDPRGPDASREMLRFFLAHMNAAAKSRH